MHKKWFRRLVTFVWAVAGMVPLPNNLNAAANELTALRYWSSPTSTRIVLDIKQRATYQVVAQPKPELLAIDLVDFSGPIPTTGLTINDGIIKTVTAHRTNSRTIRLTIELVKPAAHKIFQMERYLEMPHRLAIDFIRRDLEQADRLRRETTRKLKKKETRIIILDPGHGGDDPGAISPKGIREKDVALSIARRIARTLNRKPGIKAYLTRTGDYYLPLGTRTKIAQEYGADLFVSIHADSNPHPELQGTSVYCLSLEGASDTTAQLLAQKENAADFIGGVPLDQHNTDLNAIIIDLVQTHSFNASVRCANIVLREVARVNTLLREQPQHAAFKVLRVPDIPSLLIETDFLSNPRMEKQLRSEAFQTRLAEAIAVALLRYVSDVKPLPSSDRPAAKSATVKAPHQNKRVRRAPEAEKPKTPAAGSEKHNTGTPAMRIQNTVTAEAAVINEKRLNAGQGENNR